MYSPLPCGTTSTVQGAALQGHDVPIAVGSDVHRRFQAEGISLPPAAWLGVEGSIAHVQDSHQHAAKGIAPRQHFQASGTSHYYHHHRFLHHYQFDSPEPHHAVRAAETAVQDIVDADISLGQRHHHHYGLGAILQHSVDSDPRVGSGEGGVKDTARQEARDHVHYHHIHHTGQMC